MSNTRRLRVSPNGEIICTGRAATCQCDRHWGIGKAKCYPDEAKRFADTVSLHLTALGGDAIGQWIAVALSDGRSDNTLYPSRASAASHQSDEDLFLYFQIPPDGLTIKEAAIGLQWNRAMYDSGLRYRTMEGQELIQPLGNERIAQQLAALRRL